MRNNSFLKNLATAFGAQGLSLLLSVCMALIFPNFFGVKEYGYWQLFVFYIGYVSLFCFGYNDGLYLTLGGKDYRDLAHNKIGAQFKVFLLVEALISALIIIMASLFVTNSDRKFVIVFFAIYLIVKNTTLYIGYIFQAVNQTRVYSLSVIIDMVISLILFLIMMLCGVSNYKLYIAVYTVDQIIALLYLGFKGRDIIWVKDVYYAHILSDMWTIISVGIKLMLANMMSRFILGVGRVVIDNVWGIEMFGKISLSLSLTNFFLLFIQQVSIVLFPALKRITIDRLTKIFRDIRCPLGLILPVVFVMYAPMNIVLSFILPQYSESLRYLALMLPICTFDGKMQMLCNTYLKVLRKEKMLLLFNVITLGISGLLCCLFGYIFNSFMGVLISMVFAIAVRSIMAEVYLAKLMETNIIKELVQEVCLVIIFVICTWNCTLLTSFLIMLCCYSLYLWINRKQISTIVKKAVKSNRCVSEEPK